MKVRPALQLTEIRASNDEVDVRAHDFDARRLEPGDPVEVLIPAEARWLPGVVRVSVQGARIDFAARDPVPFADAVAVGLRRVLH